jgi:hypothetical protein
MPTPSEPGTGAARPAPAEERPRARVEPDLAPAGEPLWVAREERRESFLLVLLRALSAWHA